MGSGKGCDAQYLFAEDILGTNRGHVPRHAKVYRNLAGELDRIQRSEMQAFREYQAVSSKHIPPIPSTHCRRQVGGIRRISSQTPSI